MDQTFVESLNITNVYQQKVTEKEINIYFTINNFLFRMLLLFDNEKSIFDSFTIDHYEDDKKFCSVCEKNVLDEPFYSACLSFDNHYNEMFQRLIQHPNIRLEWLYLPHAEQA